MNLVDQFLVNLVLTVIQVQLVFPEQKVRRNLKENRKIVSSSLGERGRQGLPGLPGNSTSIGGFPGPQGRMCLVVS